MHPERLNCSVQVSLMGSKKSTVIDKISIDVQEDKHKHFQSS